VKSWWFLVSVNVIVFSLADFGFAQTRDYSGLPYTDQTLRFAAGLSYSKLESYSETGNYFLLSNTNPKFEIRYFSKFADHFRHIVYVNYGNELYVLENPQFVLVTKDVRHRGFLAWNPQWFSAGMGYSFGINSRLKGSTLISKLPGVFDVSGDVGEIYLAELGTNFVWYGQTVSRLPLSIDLDLAYSAVLSQRSTYKYYDGWVYRFGIDFDFNRRSFFANWNIRFFYEYEKLRTELNPFVNKEMGFLISRSLSF
jgi:hypothetical protein